MKENTQSHHGSQGGRPLYRVLRESCLELTPDAHFGLWYERFFDQYQYDQKEKSGWQVSAEGKQNWIQTITRNGKTCGDPELLDNQKDRLQILIKELGGTTKAYATDWHFVTGLGLNHPVENGFSWHPTLGVPYLPGSAVKGLLRAWITQWTDLDTEEVCWFGDQDKAGDLICFDALPIEPVELILDVMTPHMGKWYEKGGEIQSLDNEPEKIPADWHNPVPVPFLAVKKGSFMFALASRSRTEYNVEAAFEQLDAALQVLGAGAKTAVGYGRFRVDEKELKRMEEEAARQKEEEQKHQQELDEQARIAALSPLEQTMEEVAKANPNEAKYLVVLQALKSGSWHGDESKQVAGYVKQWMMKAKKWKEKTEAKKPEKDKDYQRTLEVMKFL